MDHQSQIADEDRIYESPNIRKVTHRMKTEITHETNIDMELLSLSNTISHAVSNLEKRLETCDGIYKLATNTNSVRDREREMQIQSTTKLLESFDSRLSQIEQTLDRVPDMVKETIAAEYSKNDYNSKIHSMLDVFITDMNDQMDALEQSITNSDKARQKNLKSVKRNLTLIQTTPNDDSAISDLEDQMISLKRTQQAMTEIFNSLRAEVPNMEQQ